MKHLPLIIWTALALCFTASANIIPTQTTTTGTGPYTWSFDLQLSNDQNIVSGLAPSTNPVQNTTDYLTGFLTIYDFAGYIPGTCAAPTGWTCTAQNVGFTPADVVPVDNPNIVNLTWSYTSGPTIVGQAPGVDLGIFSANSIYSHATQVSYAARGIKNLGMQIGTISDNVGSTSGPASSVPEPAPAASLAAGLGLAGLVWKVRRSRSEA